MHALPLALSLLLLVQPQPEPPATPGAAYAPPERPTAEGAPLIYAFSEDAGPDQSFLLVGEGLTDEIEAWGPHPEHAGGAAIKPKVQLCNGSVLIATLPDRCYDGPIVVWAKNARGWSEPAVLNRPNLWWCGPRRSQAADKTGLCLFGRNLATRPDGTRGHVYIEGPAGAGRWQKVSSVGKYRLEVEMPGALAGGEHRVWVHAGVGGKFGWSDPLKIEAPHAAPPAAGRAIELQGDDVQAAVDAMAARGGGVVKLPPGVFQLKGTLVVPARVTVCGAGADKTTLLAPSDPAAPLANIASSGWNQAPGAVHTPGDLMAYEVDFPAAGRCAVWLRYATEMKPYNLQGVSKHMTLAVGGGAPMPLDNLPNTGSFGTFAWSKAAEAEVPAGKTEVVWKNVQGGGISLDAICFSFDPAFTPSDTPLPKSGPKLLVVQAEDVKRFETKEGKLPGGERAAVWLAGDSAAVESLTVRGSPRTNIGIAVRSAQHPAWVRGCRIERTKVCDVEGKQGENCGVRLFRARDAVVQDNVLWGRAPIFLSGAVGCTVKSNELYSVTRFGGNAEGYILARNDTVRNCTIADNRFCTPPGMNAGGPTGRRMIWLSTGRGSVDHNWIAGNQERRARFGGVAGTDQNVGEMILFEACERIAYHGPAAAADRQSVTLPAKLPPTPDERLGSVQRGQLAHDAEGNETPFWPPETDDGTPEAAAAEYFVTVLRGRGMGQTRPVAARSGATYRLARPWRVAPDQQSTILVHTAFYRNHIVENRTVDGMTGIQLWITCIENVLSDNEVARQRKPGLYLYGNCSTLASSMPQTWNRGIGPLWFNHIEGTRCDETSCGALVTSGEEPRLPVEFPRCLGNVLRHNSFVRNRTDGLLVTGNRPAGQANPSPAVLGTIAEFNVARDATTGYRVAQSAEMTLLRRNHAYFWYPVTVQPGPRVGLQIDNPDAAAVMELNSVEGIHGAGDGPVIVQQRGPEKPAATK